MNAAYPRGYYAALLAFRDDLYGEVAQVHINTAGGGEGVKEYL